MKRIVLKGYYGFGNLGDDILMLTCSKWLKEVIPNAQIYVATASRQGDYIVPFTGGSVEGVVPLSPEPEADLVVYGGGGVFYDFDGGNWFYCILNRFIRLIGKDKFRVGLDTFRKLKGWPPNRYTKRMAVGVGLGTFTPCSKKYYHKIAELAGLDLILPRDPDSFRILEGHGISGEVVQSSDLACLSTHWIPTGFEPKPDPRRIGLVIKYWPADGGFLAALSKTARMLEDQGYLVTIFLFEKDHDQPIISQFRDFEVKVWCPRTGSLADYLRLLAEHSLLVTSRAHGAIIGAAFGIPSICIGIERKLDQIAKMFPKSSRFLDLPLTFNDLHNKIISGSELPRDRVLGDFEENQKILLNSLVRAEKYLQKV